MSRMINDVRFWEETVRTKFHLSKTERGRVLARSVSRMINDVWFWEETVRTKFHLSKTERGRVLASL